MLVIRPFITLPAPHSPVGVNAISPDSHNYPKIERGREISLEMALWVKRSLGKYTEREGGHFGAFPTRPAVSVCTVVVCLDNVKMFDDHLLQES